MHSGHSNQSEYIDGQLRPTHPALFAQFAEWNAAAVQQSQPELDLAYGQHPRQRLDLFRTGRQRRAVAVFFHAGYWQSRDKSGFHFLAPSLLADGIDLALINYPLSPELGVMEIVAAARGSLSAVASLTGHAPQILIGHSAGAQIAAEICSGAQASAADVAGIVSISGVFDLAPLIGTTVNDKLGLDHAAAHAASPLHRVTGGAPRAIFAVGADETAAFRDQTARMAAAWSAAGNPARELTVPGADHFSILTSISQEGGMLRRAIAGLVSKVQV